MPAAAPAGHPPRWAWWVIGIVIPVLGTAVTVFAQPGKTNGAPLPVVSTIAPTAPTPTPTPTGTGSHSVAPTVAALPSRSPVSPNPPVVPDLSAPAGYQPHQARWGISPPICGEALLVDLDTGMSTPFKLETAGESATDAQTAATELEYRPHSQGCGLSGRAPTSTELRSVTGRQVGVLRAGQPQTFENCRAAAGTGFGPVRMGGPAAKERGLAPGAALCSITDQGSVSMALIDGIDDETTPTMSGKLITWSKG